MGFPLPYTPVAALGGRRVGEHYTALPDRLAAILDFDCDLTVEMISHRFTPGSKDVLLQWYPSTSLDLEEAGRAAKRNKFGGAEYVCQPEDMRPRKQFSFAEWQRRFPLRSLQPARTATWELL